MNIYKFSGLTILSALSAPWIGLLVGQLLLALWFSGTLSLSEDEWQPIPRRFPSFPVQAALATVIGPVSQINPAQSFFQGSGSTIAATEVISCTDYHLHQAQLDVGQDGSRRIANSTTPAAGGTAIAEVTIPLLALDKVELARFYSDPPLATGLTIRGDIGGTIWVQTTNFDDTTFTAQLFDYNPANGQKISLGELVFKVINDGQTDTALIITPPQVTIPTGHRLLFMIYAQAPILTSPTVKLFYDSLGRDSFFTLCQVAPPQLTISKSGPAAAIAGQPVTYTLRVTNSGGLTATQLLISDTLPAGAGYLSGGTLTGQVVTWSVPSLAPGATVQQSFGVTATKTITNTDYRVSAEANVFAVGQKGVVTSVSQPGQPNLTISKSGPASASPGALITYTLTVANGGDTAASHLVISDTLPVGAYYIGGGTRQGEVISWTAGSLAANDEIQFSFRVTASQTISNTNYRVTADGQVSATGQETIVTMVIPEQKITRVYLPHLIKSDPPTLLIVQSVNTGGINPLRILTGDNQQLLSCVIGDNITQTCGSFPAIGTYKIVAFTGRCGVLQGSFNDAQPGKTITRQVICN